MKDWEPVDYQPGKPARQKIDALATEFNALFFPTSAKEGFEEGGIKDALDTALMLSLYPELNW